MKGPFATEREARACAFLEAVDGRLSYVVRGVELFYVFDAEQVPRDLTGEPSGDVVSAFGSASDLS